MVSSAKKPPNIISARNTTCCVKPLRGGPRKQKWRHSVEMREQQPQQQQSGVYAGARPNCARRVPTHHFPLERSESTEVCREKD